MLLGRVIRRSRRLVHEIADLSRRGRLRSRPRTPRAATPIDDLRTKDVLVVIAHPDDEVLVAGALLRYVPKGGVICASNGSPLNERYARDAGYDNWLDYAHARVAEAEAALRLLDRPISPMLNLRISDQEVFNHLAPLSRFVANVLNSDFSHVVTHAYEGGHPDHDSVAFAVHAACVLMQRAGRAPPVIVEAPLYNAPIGDFVYHEFLPHEDAGPAIRLDLTPEEQNLKQRMRDRHATQEKLLASFRVDVENFRLAPRYHFAARPHAGRLGYESFKWPITGRRWRRSAWNAMRELDLLEVLA